MVAACLLSSGYGCVGDCDDHEIRVFCKCGTTTTQASTITTTRKNIFPIRDLNNINPSVFLYVFICLYTKELECLKRHEVYNLMQKYTPINSVKRMIQ